MIPVNIENLIKALLEKTIAKKAIWGKTARPNEFKLHLEKGAVTTDNWVDNNGEQIDFAIYNILGDKIEYFIVARGEADYILLADLHNAAKREFFKVDETINGLFSELKSDKNVGNRKIEGEEDLPF